MLTFNVFECNQHTYNLGNRKQHSIPEETGSHLVILVWVT